MRMRKSTWKIIRPIVKIWIELSDILAPILFFFFTAITYQLWLFWRGGMSLLEMVRTPEWYAIGFAFPVIYIALFAWWFRRKRKEFMRINPKSIISITERLDETLKNNLQPLEKAIQELTNEIRGLRNERKDKHKP